MLAYLQELEAVSLSLSFKVAVVEVASHTIILLANKFSLFKNVRLAL